MKTILLDTEGDLDLTSGGMKLSGDNDAEYTRQRISNRIRFFLGEWFLDQRLGVPYFKDVFVKNPDLSFLRSLYRKIILSVPSLATLDTLELSLVKETRTLQVAWAGVLIDGTEIPRTLVPFVL